MAVSVFNPDILANPRIFAQNRLKAVSDHKFYRNEAECAAGQSGLIRLLDGKWRFHYAVNLSGRPLGFEQEGYDDSAFGYINVPGHFETQGYGVPHYTNIFYPWQSREEVRPGRIPQEFNPVGSYVRTFEHDPAFKNTFICLEGVDSAFALWLNGHYVGYSEDSCTPSRFDLTPYIKAGTNRLCVQVYKYSSGSFLEDQDFWRVSGIFRHVYLYTKPALHLEDCFIKTALDDAYQNAELTVDLEFAGSAGHGNCQVLDPDGNIIAETSFAPDCGSLNFALEDCALWSAEDPQLYTLCLTLFDDNGSGCEYVRQDFGVREFSLKNKVMLINGRRILINGVNRHEFSCSGGRTLTDEEIYADLLLMKRYNINAVRTSHYPNSSVFYDYCDRLGLYVIDETNLETHGSWQKNGIDCPDEDTLPDGHPEWHDAVMSRGEAMLERDKNHPCIIIWSCGNESFGGSTLFDLSNYFRARDPSRLVHYEGVFHDRRYNGTSDMETQMYPSVAAIEAFLKEHDDKPFICCEYTHAMGNSNGGMHLYTNLAKSGGLYQGGFIWDFADQAFNALTGDGRSYLAYGGDFGDRPTDYNFACNGIVFADRALSPKLQDIKFNYQMFTLKPDLNGVDIVNYNLFTDLGAYDVVLKLRRNGVVIFSAVLDDLKLAPQQQGRFDYVLPEELMTAPGEYAAEVSVCLKSGTAWAEAGHEIAFGQQVIASVQDNAGDEVREQELTWLQGKMRFINTPANTAVVGANFSVIFNNARGCLVSLKSNGRELLKLPAALNFWRAPTDNDYGNGMPHRLGIWKIAGSQAKCVSAAAGFDHGEAVITYEHELGTVPRALVQSIYKVNAAGEIDVTLNYKKTEGLPDVPEFGLLLRLYGAFNAIEYYGLGPDENYCDRQEGARLGLFKSDVASEYVPYLKPQECGSRGGVRYFKVSAADGTGLEIRQGLDQPAVSALPYTPDELESAAHGYELPDTDTTVLKIALRPMGVGGDDSWGAPVLEPYLNHNEDMSFNFKLCAF